MPSGDSNHFSNHVFQFFFKLRCLEDRDFLIGLFLPRCRIVVEVLDDEEPVPATIAEQADTDLPIRIPRRGIWTRPCRISSDVFWIDPDLRGL